MKCPLCAREMSKITGAANSATDPKGAEMIYFCEKHGVMNRTYDLRDKVNQIARRR